MLKIADIEIQCISIYLPEITPASEKKPEKNWPKACLEADEYFKSHGIEILWTWGINGEKFGIEASRPYQRDVPDTDWKLEPRTVSGYLSGYQILNVAKSHPEWKYIAILEEDCRLVENWRERLEQALKDVDDFDMLYLGSCCTEGRPTEHIKGEVYEVKYPLCFHFTIINTRCLIVLMSLLRDACKPWDIHLFDDVNPRLKVRTILPRLANQLVTELPL